ncbi:FHA domain-containing protein [bacterium]|nr:FHA domain-containing protein [bacterium]
MSKNNVEQPEFLADVQKLQEQIGSLKKRLNLVEDNREKVRQKIYEKVRGEYEKKLEEMFDELKPFQEKIETEVTELQVEIQMHKENVESSQENLEEYQLRFFAGEFSDDEFEPKQNELKGSINTSNTSISELEEQIFGYQKHLSFITGEPLVEKVEESADSDEGSHGDEEELPEEDLEEDPAENLDEEHDEDLNEKHDEEIEEHDEDLNEEHDDEFDDFMPEPDIDPSLNLDDEDQGLLKDTVDSSILPDHDFQLDDGDDELQEENVIQDQDEEEYKWSGIPILDVVDGDFTGESYTIDKERITMGRGPNNDIQLATDTSVSRHHAQIALEDSKYVLVDLESSNGTSVNGMRVSRSVLKPNDEIMIGQSKIVIRTQD